MRQEKQRVAGVPRKGVRSIVVGGQTWRWSGKAGTAVLWSPDGSKYVARMSDVRGVTEDVFERGQWKITSDGSVCPSHVRAYIERITAGGAA